MPDYDVVVMGAGPAGALVAAELGAAGRSVLVLEAGPAAGRTWADYQANVDHYLASPAKVPNSPYAPSADAPFPSVLDIEPLAPGGPPGDAGYFVQEGPLPFTSDYLRSAGGTTMHWLGTCLRMVPDDFGMRRAYGQARDWPISYDELEPVLRRAERELGVGGRRRRPGFFGVWFPEGYVYPMHRMPQSTRSISSSTPLTGKSVQLVGGNDPLKVVSTSRGAQLDRPTRNTTLGEGYEPVPAPSATATRASAAGQLGVHADLPRAGQVQRAQDAARRRASRRSRSGTQASRRSCASTREPAHRAALEYKHYDDRGACPRRRDGAPAELFVLAANAIENAKLLLASSAANSSGQVGRNLMDHPFMMAWALCPTSVGPFRGPDTTAGLERLRDGRFRQVRAAFRARSRTGAGTARRRAVHGRRPRLSTAGTYGAALRCGSPRRMPRQVRLGFMFEQLPARHQPRRRSTAAPRRARQLPAGAGLRLRRLHAPRDGGRGEDVRHEVFALLGASDATAYLPRTRGYVTSTARATTTGRGTSWAPTAWASSRGHSVVDDRQRAWDHENLYLVGRGQLADDRTANPTLTLAALVAARRRRDARGPAVS